jgi:tetratricopeptide (TPR) repeat protein
MPKSSEVILLPLSARSVSIGAKSGVCRLIDGALIVLVVAATFLLGCQELFDSDVWWHVRAGQWIWANGRVPALDPFTFASADRPWIDLHWLFQLMLAGAHRLGGVAGMILLASSICAKVILVGLTARDRRWPMAVIVACWLPALGAMSARFDPRPEIISLLATAVFLAVLFRTDRTPALAWSLPLVQVIWVNSHGLFVLGPIILGAFLIDQIAGAIRRRRTRANTANSPGRRWWLHVGGAALAVVAACLVNPYGWRGAIFPFELFPKITAWGGSYKSYVDEFMDLRTFVQTVGLESAATDFFFLTECFLLWMLPLSFIFPAVWQASRPPAARGAAGSRRSLPWLVAFGLAAALIAACTLGFAEPGYTRWIAQVGRFAPWGLIAIGFGGAILLLVARAPGAPALLAASGGAAEATWILWLRGHLRGPEPSLYIGAIGIVLGLTATVYILRLPLRGRLFRVSLSFAFGYLALVAVRNVNLFALVAGFVMAWNLGEWAFELTSLRAESLPAPRWMALPGLVARGGLALLVGLWITAISSGWFFRAAGEVRRFGLGESPLAYAHEAARFAGRPGMPERALALDLRQAGVYLFHNGPERKLFIDGRLEVPSRATFESFVRLGALLNGGRTGWSETVRRMRNPLILLDHVEDAGAEATLLAQPDWRCVYYDPVASIFVADRPGEPAREFPAVDFAGRHFRDPAWRAVPAVPLGIGEAAAMIRLGSELVRRPGIGSRWALRFSLMLLASDRSRQGLASGFGSDSGPQATAGLWNLLGHCSWNMTPDLRVRPAGPDEPWDPARSLLMAQAAYSYRRSLEFDRHGASALAALRDSFKARRMSDAQRAASERLFLLKPAGPSSDGATRLGASEQSQTSDGGGEPVPAWENGPDLARAVNILIENGRPEAAVRLFAEGMRHGIAPSWPVGDRVAATLLHLGRPDEARELWERVAPPSRALQLARVATTSLAMLDFETALRIYSSALEIDPKLAEAWFGVALLHTQRGDAAAALAAAREGLKRSPTPAQQAFLTAIEAFVAPHSSAQRASPHTPR